MANVLVQESSLSDIADSIRAKNGTQDTYKPSQMAAAIDAISTGTDTSDATLNSAGQMLSGVTAYANGVKYTGNIPSKTSGDLTASGATVTVPAGHYANGASKSVASGSATTPATGITANPTISVNSSGLITASVSANQSITPSVSPGYVSIGTAGAVSVNGSGTKQLTTQAAKTVTPGTSSQTAVAARVYTTGTVTVAPIPTNISGTYKKVTGFEYGLKRSTPKALSTARSYLAGASVGNYALFGGGYASSYSTVVDAYNTSLTRSTPTALSTARSFLAGASVGNYALFGGGSTGSNSAVVDAYNTSLTRSTPTALSSARSKLAGASVGNYALFGGGGSSDAVDAYGPGEGFVLTLTTGADLFGSSGGISGYAAVA